MGLDNDGIVQELNRMDRETQDLKENIIRMSWYMRGGASINELWEMSSAERQVINKLIKENLETTKKSGMPFF